MDYLYGVLDLGFWGYVIAVFLMVQLAMMSVTLYLHRDQAHRSIDLHPVLQHIFRLWIWMTSGIVTRQWVAVHRKHHALCEQEGDPHSPKVFGLKKVLLEGSELYRDQARNPETCEKYGRGCPEDWIERHVYSKHHYLGIGMLVVLDLILFGVPGIIIIAIQLSTMPVMAAGVINGLGHAVGYRNFDTDDASTNLVPWGLIVGGEELHNNHHAFPSSAKFSIRPWEFDIGWFYLTIFKFFGLAKIRRVAPRPDIDPAAPAIPDLDNLRAVIINRMHVLRNFSREVTVPELKRELSDIGQPSLLRRMRRMLSFNPTLLDEESRARLREQLDRLPTLKTIVEYRDELGKLWEGANVSNERLLAQFKEWCARAEASGIRSLEEFAASLKGYRLAEAS